MMHTMYILSIRILSATRGPGPGRGGRSCRATFPQLSANGKAFICKRPRGQVLGQTWANASSSCCSGSASTYTQEQALAYAKAQTGWRLPNVKELASLADLSRVSPAIDVTAFPGMPSSVYWTASPYAGDASYAWSVDFYDGYVGNGNRNYNSAVRLVR